MSIKEVVELIIKILICFPEIILFVVGLIFVFLGLVKKIPLGEKREITIPEKYRQPAIIIGIFFIIGAIVWLIAEPNRGKPVNCLGTPTPTITSTLTPTTTLANTVTFTPTLTPTATQVHTVTFTSTPDPPDPKEEVQRVVEKYFAHLNNEEYREAWEILTPRFRIDQKGGFSGYEEWWITIKEVEISEFRSAYVDKDNDEGEIVATLFYIREENPFTNEYRFCLIYNELQERWLIDYQLHLPGDC